MKEEKYSVGDLLKKTEMYAANYPQWKVNEGKLISVRAKSIPDDILAAVDRAMYRFRYGAQTKYPIFELFISTSDGDRLVSQFGFNKD